MENRFRVDSGKGRRFSPGRSRLQPSRAKENPPTPSQRSWAVVAQQTTHVQGARCTLDFPAENCQGVRRGVSLRIPDVEQVQIIFAVALGDRDELPARGMPGGEVVPF